VDFLLHEPTGVQFGLVFAPRAQHGGCPAQPTGRERGGRISFKVMSNVAHIVGVEPKEIALLSESLRLLAEASTLDEIKDIRDKAEALRLYVKQQGEGLEIQNAAAEIKIRAERRAGKILIEMDLHSGRPSERNGSIVEPLCPPRLSDLGIDKKQSFRWQKIASVPDETFETHIQETKGSDKELTSAGVMRLESKQHETPTTPAWSLDDAVDYLGSKLYEISQRWPKDRIEVMVHQLHSLADELLEYGELRQ
jgi:hypothetical protein